MLIDTHSHLNFKDFDKDRGEVIERSLKNNVWLINASSTFNTSKLAVEIAEKYPEGVYASVGLHPIHVREEEFYIEKYRKLAKNKKVVAIGETGLDFMYSEKERQKQVFLQHIELARELDLPIIFHCRKAHNELIEILRFHVSRFKFHGVVHCFTGRWREAEQYLEMGLYFGFNGIIFKFNVDEIIKKMPLNRILIETDCPYLTPPLPRRSSNEIGTEAAASAKAAASQRNEPIFVKYIAERISELRGESFENIAQATTQNAIELFNLT